MKIAASSVEDYLSKIPEDRRAAIQAVRETIRKNLDSQYEEGMQYGMIGYYVPHRIYPAGYHCDSKQPLPFASIASQKNHMAVYLMCIYMDRPHGKWFMDAYAKSGKKLDAGKSCIRFTKVEDLALDVIGEAVRRWPAKAYVAHYEKLRGQAGGAKSKPAVKRKPAGSKR
jgi:uncharacterized protein YdhG (YjbR/CyaY superfamily)